MHSIFYINFALTFIVLNYFILIMIHLYPQNLYSENQSFVSMSNETAENKHFSTSSRMASTSFSSISNKNIPLQALTTGKKWWNKFFSYLLNSFSWGFFLSLVKYFLCWKLFGLTNFFLLRHISFDDCTNNNNTLSLISSLSLSSYSFVLILSLLFFSVFSSFSLSPI